MALRNSRRWMFMVAAMTMSLVATGVVLLGADLYVHHRASRSAGLNRWGYRGPVVGRKRADETRIAMLGGSTVFGYGVFWNQAIPALLEGELQQASTHPVSVVNLGFNNEGAFALEPTLQDFAYLNIDVAAFYTGYNDAVGDVSPNTAVYRHESPVFRLTGYYPILPLALQEKATAIRTGGQLVAANEAKLRGTPKPVFRPGLAERAGATAMEVVAAASETVAQHVNRLAPEEIDRVPAADTGCAYPWVTYCHSMEQAIRYARQRNIKVLVVLPPLMTNESRPPHVDQQRALAAMVARNHGGDPNVRIVDLSRAVDLSDRHYSFDQMHLDPQGNAVIAHALLAPVRELAFNDSFGGNPSAHLLQGAYLRQWLAANSVALSVMAIVGEFGMMWLLAPAWPRNLAIGAYVLANLRLGSQLPYVPSARLGLVISMLVSVVLLTYRQPPPGESEVVRAA